MRHVAYGEGGWGATDVVLFARGARLGDTFTAAEWINIYTYIYIHTHTHIHIFIFIFRQLIKSAEKRTTAKRFAFRIAVSTKNATAAAAAREARAAAGMGRGACGSRGRGSLLITETGIAGCCLLLAKFINGLAVASA